MEDSLESREMWKGEYWGVGQQGKEYKGNWGGATRRIDQNAVGIYVTYYENPIWKPTILQVNLDNKNQNKKEAMSTKEK